MGGADDAASVCSTNPILKSLRTYSTADGHNPMVKAVHANSSQHTPTSTRLPPGENPILKAPHTHAGKSAARGNPSIAKPAAAGVASYGRNPILKDARPPATVAGGNPILPPPKRQSTAAAKPTSGTSSSTHYSSRSPKQHPSLTNTSATASPVHSNTGTPTGVGARRKLFTDSSSPSMPTHTTNGGAYTHKPLVNKATGAYTHQPKSSRKTPVSPRTRKIPVSPRTRKTPVSPRTRKTPVSPRTRQTPVSPRTRKTPRSPRSGRHVPTSPRSEHTSPVAPYSREARESKAPKSASMQRAPRPPRNGHARQTSKTSISMPRQSSSVKYAGLATNGSHPSPVYSAAQNNDTKGNATRGALVALAHRDKVIAKRRIAGMKQTGKPHLETPLYDLEEVNSSVSDSGEHISRPMSPVSPQRDPEHPPKKMNLSHLKLPDSQVNRRQPMHVSRTAGSICAEEPTMFGEEWPDANDVPWSSGLAYPPDMVNRKHKDSSANGISRPLSPSPSGDADHAHHSNGHGHRVVRRNASERGLSRSKSPSASETTSSSNPKSLLEDLEGALSRRGSNVLVPKSRRSQSMAMKPRDISRSRSTSRSPNVSPQPSSRGRGGTVSLRHSRATSTCSVTPTPAASYGFEATSTSSSSGSTSSSTNAQHQSPPPGNKRTSLVGVSTLLNDIFDKRQSQTSVDYESEDEMEKLTERECIIHELVNTERSYVQSLNELLRVYVEPILNTKEKIMDEKSSTSLKDVFSSIEKILPLNTMFLKSLEKRVDECVCVTLVNTCRQ